MSHTNTTVCSWEASAQFHSVSEEDMHNSISSLGILNEVSNLYEESMRNLEADSSSGNDDLKITTIITTLQAWVYNLGEANKLLVLNLEELEQKMIRLKKQFEENRRFGANRKNEMLVDRLNSDLKNICKLIRRGLETNDWSTKVFKFFQLNDWEIFGPMLHSLNNTKNRERKSTNSSFVEEENASIASFERPIRNLQNTVNPCDGIEEIFLKRNVRESTSSLTFKATCLTPESSAIGTDHYRELVEIQKKGLENFKQEKQSMLDRDSLAEIELKRRLEENEMLLAESRRVTRDLEQQLEGSRKDNEALRNKLREKEELFLSASKRNKDDANTIKTQAERLISLGNSFNERKQNILDLQSENRILSNTIKEKDKEIMDILVRHTQKRVCSSCTSKEVKINALKTEMETIFKSLQGKDDRLRLVTNENAKLSGKIKLKNKDIADSKRELQRYKNQFEENRKQFSSMTNKIFEEQQMTAEAVTVANNQLEMHLTNVKRQ